MFGQNDCNKPDAQVLDRLILAAVVALAAAIPPQLETRRDWLVVAVIFWCRLDLVVARG